MENKKYILTDETIEVGVKTLHRIKALKDFGDVNKGDLGGYIESEKNLSHRDDCWIYDHAMAYDNAMVHGNAIIKDYAVVFDDVEIFGNAIIKDYAVVFEDAEIFDNARVSDNALVYGDANIYDNAMVYDNAKVYGDAVICCNAKVYSDFKVTGKLTSKVDDFIEIQNPKGRLVTCILKDNQLLFNVGCQIEITEEKFIDRIYNKNGGIEKNPYRKYYLNIIKMAKVWADDILNK